MNICIFGMLINSWSGINNFCRARKTAPGQSIKTSASINIHSQRLLAVFLIGFLIYTPAKQAYSQNPGNGGIDIIKKNILTQNIKDVDKVKLKNEVAKWSRSLSENGSWPDLDYDTRSRGKWDPGSHLQRLRQMAEAYMLNIGDLPELYQKIENAVFYWINRTPEPESDNWYYATISTPLDIGYILLFMQESPRQLPVTAINGLLRWMKKSRKIENQASTTLNRMLAIGLHYILRGCVTKNDTLIKQAITYVNQMMEPDSGYTGIQADHSFLYHGDQIYIQGYGTSFLQRIAEFAEIVKGSPYSLSEKNFREVFNYSRNTFYKVARGPYLDYAVLGRNIARVGNINAGHRLAPLLETYRKLDAPDQSDHYQAAIDRFSGDKPADYKITPEHLQLWSSDYSAHIRPEYFTGLRMVSTRTVKPERGNGENILEHFRGNGAMSIMIRGNEYLNIFPVWKWNQIPGTTVPALQDLSGQEDWFNNYGKTDFVGGVSDGKYGAAVYDMNDYNTQAKKSWFFFDRQIVCLGAGINSRDSAPIYTTINQSLSNGGVEIKTAEGIKTYTNDGAWADLKVLAIKNDEVGYSFPGSETAQVSNETQVGSWRRINTNLSKDTVKKRVFKLHIDHGLQPSNASYAYLIWPGISSINDIQPDEISILKNTEKIQAVYNKEKNICQAAFYEAGSLNLGKMTLSVNQPCLIIIKNLSGRSPIITVSDPTQKLKTIEIRLNGSKKKKQRVWTCNLPEGKMAGKSVELN